MLIPSTFRWNTFLRLHTTDPRSRLKTRREIVFPPRNRFPASRLHRCARWNSLRITRLQVLNAFVAARAGACYTTVLLNEVSEAWITCRALRSAENSSFFHFAVSEGKNAKVRWNDGVKYVEGRMQFEWVVERLGISFVSNYFYEKWMGRCNHVAQKFLRYI